MKRKITRILFALATGILLCACAHAGQAIDDGLYTVGVSSNSKMFKVVNCVLRVEDGRMTAILTLSGTGYGYLFAGTAEQAAAAPRDTWSGFEQDDEGRYCYAVEIPALDSEVAVAAYSTRYEKWYDRTLKFFSDTLSPYCLLAQAGEYEGTLSSNTDLDGAACTLFSKEGVMRVEIDQNKIKQMLVDGARVEFCDGRAVFELKSLDVNTPVSVRYESGAQEGYLMLDKSALRPRETALQDGVYSVSVKSDSSLLAFSRCALTVTSGHITALLTARNNSFDYLYPGLAKDAPRHEQDWIPALPDSDGAYTYLLEIDSLKSEMPLAIYSAKKKLWYDRGVVFDMATLQKIGE